jgi:peptide/nickel transport system permease protein
MAASRGMRLAAWHFRRSFASSLGLGLVATIVLLALLGPWIVPYPDDVAGGVNLTGKLQSPSAAHWFGTDEVGNDIFTRVIIGARLSLLVGIGISFAAAAIGVPLGILAGTAGG